MPKTWERVSVSISASQARLHKKVVNTVLSPLRSADKCGLELRCAALGSAAHIVLPLASNQRTIRLKNRPPRSTYFSADPTMPDDLLSLMLPRTRESVLNEGHKKGKKATNIEEGLK
ncbi:hypothetical protein NDU88_001190 [Pleurodeles waltl]|uniref:Uncharacterized protein n=1 Tax=Pleurodeles waltl TaxID=8319 RepID=A0AAV7WLL5_PLEWA|nr:hypothetical protein NDU88_001190 [Pleurodeles waltl]